MKSEYIINTIENILLEQQCFLSSLDVAILKGVLDGYSYSKIASRLSSSAGCITNHADKLCERISAAMNTTISKNDLGLFLRIVYNQKRQAGFADIGISKVERSIEFPPEYWGAGTSILSYFSHILNVKYPSKK